MSKFWVGNLYLLLAILRASGSQIMVKALLNETGALTFNWSWLQAVYSSGRDLRMLAALAVLVTGFLFWIMSLSRLNLSYAHAFACSSALLVNSPNVLFLNEEVSVRMWWGTAFIVLGTTLLTPSR